MLLNQRYLFIATFVVFVGTATVTVPNDTAPGNLNAYIEPICNDTISSICRNFRCSVSSNDVSTIQWYFKPCENESCNYEYIKGNLEENKLQYSSNVTIDDEKWGHLKCLVKNLKDQIEVFYKVIPLNKTERQSIILIERRSSFHIIPKREEIVFDWHISVQGKPKPDLFLLINNEPIYPGTSSKYSYTVNFDNVFLIIKNASYQDRDTTFKLLAKNIYENATLNLSFDASELPNVHLEVDFLNRTYSRLKCEFVSLFETLETDISWLYAPCFDATCEYILMEEALERKKSNLKITSYLNVNSSMKGVVKCTNSNNHYDIWDVEDVTNGFDIYGITNIVDIDDNTKSLHIDYLTPDRYLLCGASTHNHTAIEWTRSNNSSLDLEYYNYVFSLVTDLKLTGNAGTFFCKATTTNGTVEIKKIQITYGESTKWSYYIIGTTAIALFLSMSVFITVKFRNYRKRLNEIDKFKVAGLMNFEKGALEHLNPALSIDEQADLLPYDTSYEIPIENLILGEQIGAGAFGNVLKGEAKNIFDGQPSTPVAIKMASRSIGDVYIKALATELKIMIHLGKHVNIVNLLGACTKNIMKRELLIIVEYCRLGNLKEYLLNSRHSFIDQINPQTGKIDFGVDSIGINSKSASSSKNDIYHNSISGHGEYYHHFSKTFSTHDLLIWSFQVARGMEYLSSRKVLHGDLAARNILLTSDNIAKICDFGFSRNLYQNETYKKTGDEMLPVKWMAIESITDKVFSSQSDVWSFGIVLWEMFSLGRTPYPGMEYSESFCEKLLDGYRMKSPQFATDEIYQIMLRCWDCEPINRPSFENLVQQLGYFLDEPIREHYINMNDGYVKMNARRFKEQNSDYLSMMSSPDFKKFSSPYRYVNIVKSAEDDEINTYV